MAGGTDPKIAHREIDPDGMNPMSTSKKIPEKFQAWIDACKRSHLSGTGHESNDVREDSEPQARAVESPTPRVYPESLF